MSKKSISKYNPQKGNIKIKIMRMLTRRFASKPSKVAKEGNISTKHGNIRVLEYGFEDRTKKPLFIDMHGGGFILGNAEFDDPLNTVFHKEADIKVVSIDYPKAPENPFPVALESIYEIILYYTGNASMLGIDTTRIGIGGHSAGANLSTAICMLAKEREDFSLVFQILDYPPLDLAADPSEKPQPKGSIPIKMARSFNQYYIGAQNAENPLISPVFATKDQLKGLPPALVIVAGKDSLHDEGVYYAERLKEAGVDVEFHDFSTVPHGFTLKPGPETDEACRIMTRFIQKNGG